MENQGKTPKQMKDSLFIFEVAMWVLVAIIFIILLFPQPANAKEHFAPNKRTYSSASYKKHKSVKKSDFACTKTKRVTRRGTRK